MRRKRYERHECFFDPLFVGVRLQQHNLAIRKTHTKLGTIAVAGAANCPYRDSHNFVLSTSKGAAPGSPCDRSRHGVEHYVLEPTGTIPIGLADESDDKQSQECDQDAKRNQEPSIPPPTEGCRSLPTVRMLFGVLTRNSLGMRLCDPPRVKCVSSARIERFW